MDSRAGWGALVAAGFIAIACAGLAFATPATAQAPASPPALAASPMAVTLHGLSGQVVVLSPSDLAALPQAHVAFAGHDGQSHDYAGPELVSLLHQVDAPLGARLHGPAVSTVVLVTAADGYRVALSLGEIDPDLHAGAKVILADQVDGHALPPSEAPARLAIAGDARPARDAREVVEVDLRQLR